MTDDFAQINMLYEQYRGIARRAFMMLFLFGGVLAIALTMPTEPLMALFNGGTNQVPVFSTLIPFVKLLLIGSCMAALVEWLHAYNLTTRYKRLIRHQGSHNMKSMS